MLIPNLLEDMNSENLGEEEPGQGHNSPAPGSDEFYRDMFRRYTNEFLPGMQDEHHANALARDRRRLATSEVSGQAIGNALGTVLGGGVVVLLAGLFGLLKEVSPAALAAIAGTLLVATVALVFAAKQRPNTPEEEARRAAAALTLLHIEAEVIAAGVRADEEPPRQDGSQ